MQQIPAGCYYETYNQIIVCPNSEDHSGLIAGFASTFGIIFLIVAAILTIGYVMNIFKVITIGEADPRFATRVVGIFIPFIGGVIGYM